MAYGQSLRLSDDHFNAIREANKPDLKTFFLNVNYLAVLRFKSRNKAVIALREVTGYRTTPHSVRYFIDGIYSVANFDLLRAWCMLFNEPLHRMLSIDYEQEDKQREELDGQK